MDGRLKIAHSYCSLYQHSVFHKSFFISSWGVFLSIITSTQLRYYFLWKLYFNCKVNQHWLQSKMYIWNATTVHILYKELFLRFSSTTNLNDYKKAQKSHGNFKSSLCFPLLLHNKRFFLFNYFYGLTIPSSSLIYTQK